MANFTPWGFDPNQYGSSIGDITSMQQQGRQQFMNQNPGYHMGSGNDGSMATHLNQLAMDPSMANNTGWQQRSQQLQQTARNQPGWSALQTHGDQGFAAQNNQGYTPAWAYGDKPADNAQKDNPWANRSGVINNFYQQNMNNPQAVSKAMREYGVSNQDFMNATGLDQGGFDKYFDPVFGQKSTQAPAVNWMDELGKEGVNEYKDPTSGTTYMRLGNSGYNPYEDVDGQYAVGKYEPSGEYSVYNSKGEDTGRKGKYGTKDFNDYLPIIALFAAGGLAGLAAGPGLGGLSAGGGVAPAAAGGVETIAALPAFAPEMAAASVPFAGGTTAAGVGAGGLTLSGITGAAKPLMAVASALGLGGGNNGGGSNQGGNTGDFGLDDIASLIGGGVDAQRQGDAARTMREWMDNSMARNESYFSPNSPEYKQLWESMSRKDAAAGRNSQYGPRTADFMAKVAQSRADNNTRMTTGLSRAYSEALNQNASKYGGLSAAIQRALQGGAITNMSSLLRFIEDFGTNSGGGAPGTNPGGYTAPDGQRYNNPSAYDTQGGYVPDPDYDPDADYYTFGEGEY
jgi:hypothetical protein